MDKFLKRLSAIGIFLLRGLGGAAIGVIIGFVVSGFFRFPGRVDTFALTESLLGVVITGLSIVAAFIVAYQWGTLDRRMNDFDVKVKENEKAFQELNRILEEVLKDTKESTKKMHTIFDNIKEERKVEKQDFLKFKEGLQKNQESFIEGMKFDTESFKSELRQIVKEIKLSSSKGSDENKI